MYTKNRDNPVVLTNETVNGNIYKLAIVNSVDLDLTVHLHNLIKINTVQI